MEIPRKIAADIIASSREESFEVAVHAACRLVFENWQGIDGSTSDSFDCQKNSLRTLSSAAVERMRRIVANHLQGASREQHFEVYEELLTIRQNRLAGGGARQGPAPLVADLMAVLSGGAKRVLDPACGIGTTLLAVGRLNPTVRLVGVESDTEAVHLARERLSLAGLQAEISVGEWLEQPGTELWDAIIVKPPLGLRQTSTPGSQRAFARGGEMTWLEAIDQRLTPNGRAYVLLPSGSTTRRGAVGTIRDALLASNRVMALVELPARSILDNNLAACLWVISGAPRPEFGEELMAVNLSTFAAGDSPDWEGVSNAVNAITAWLSGAQKTDVPSWLGQYLPARKMIDRGVALPSSYLDHRPQDIDQFVSPLRGTIPAPLLTELRLENFKSVGRPVRIPLKPLTLIFGKNSAGKSSVLQSLLLLKQSIQQPTLNPYGPDTHLGSYESLIHKHNSDLHLQWGVTFAAPKDEAVAAPVPGRLRQIDISFAWDREAGSAYPQTVGGVFADRQVTWSGGPTGKFDLPVSELQALAEVEESERTRRGLVRSESVYRKLLSTLQQADMSTIHFAGNGLLPGHVEQADLEHLASAGEGAPFWASSSASLLQRTGELVSQVTSELSELLAKIVYLGPLREAPTRLSQRGAAGSGIDIPFHLLHNVSERRVVSTHLQDLGMRYQLDAVPVVTPAGDSFVGELAGLVLTDVRTGVRLSPSDVGFGVSQVLPIIVELAARSNSVIMIEQPEIHLHPGMQAELADLLIESADQSGRGNQVIAETHSESLVLRVQRRVKDGTLDNQDVAIIYVDQNQEGDCVVQELRLDEDGNFLDEWPHGFFEEQFDELFGGF